MAPRVCPKTEPAWEGAAAPKEKPDWEVVAVLAPLNNGLVPPNNPTPVLVEVFAPPNPAETEITSQSQKEKSAVMLVPQNSAEMHK